MFVFDRLDRLSVERTPTGTVPDIVRPCSMELTIAITASTRECTDITGCWTCICGTRPYGTVWDRGLGHILRYPTDNRPGIPLSDRYVTGSDRYPTVIRPGPTVIRPGPKFKILPDNSVHPAARHPPRTPPGSFESERSIDFVRHRSCLLRPPRREYRYVPVYIRCISVYNRCGGGGRMMAVVGGASFVFGRNIWRPCPWDTVADVSDSTRTPSRNPSVHHAAPIGTHPHPHRITTVHRPDHHRITTARNANRKCKSKFECRN